MRATGISRYGGLAVGLAVALAGPSHVHATTVIWVNTPAYSSSPVLADTFETHAVGGAPTGWTSSGSAVVVDSFNHTALGSRSVALTAEAGQTASLTFAFPDGIQGYSLAVFTLSHLSEVKLNFLTTADTYSELDVYDFVAGTEMADAGLGMALQESMPAEFYGNWNVFDWSGPIYNPLLGYAAGPSVDHKPTHTDWDHPQVISVPAGPTHYQSMTVSLVNDGATAATIYVDDLRGFDQPIIAAPVPEPSAWALMVLGLAGLGAVLRSRRRRPGQRALVRCSLAGESISAP